MKKIVGCFLAGVILGIMLWGGQSLSARAASNAVDVTVVVTDFEYAPLDIEIDQGDTVRWENQNGTHNVSSTIGPESFRNGDPAAGSWSFEFTFNTPGLYSYVCETPGHIALGMEGQITVNPRFFNFLPSIIK